MIDESLPADRDVPPKQRHTGRRTRRRLVDDMVPLAAVTVRQHLCRDHGPAGVEGAFGARTAAAIDGRRRGPCSPGAERRTDPAGGAGRAWARSCKRINDLCATSPTTTTSVDAHDDDPPRNAQTAALEALIEAHVIESERPTVRRRFSIGRRSLA
jgi:hypothetical protein